MSNSRINILDEQTSNRIAAGEVIERPASVVKELVENSIDAGATNIRIDLEDGGKELIKVSDNGMGMSREDSVVCLQRHATSKITSADDLFAIHTLGFRGEAMPSIASVSFMEIVTKMDDDQPGTKLEISGGTITNLESVGAPKGTTISVRRLFFNTPARLKFLKTAQTELGHITDLIGKLALAYPHVSLKLMHGTREILSVAGTNDVLGAITSVYGRDTARQLIPIKFETEPLKVWGYISKPEFTRANRSQQVFFVNRRPVRSKSIIHACDQAYRDVIVQQGRYPSVVVFVDVDPDLVDVNVHPTKAEVKFSRENDVHSIVYKAVRDALMGGGAMPSVAAPRHVGHSQPAPPKRDFSAQGTLIYARETDVTAFREAVLDRSRSVEIPVSGDPFAWDVKPVAPTVVPSEEVVEPAPAVAPEPVKLANLKVIGQARNMYIIAEAEDGVLIIDQHVAHERVLFEQLMKSRHVGGAVMQGLVIPVTLELSRREALVVSERLEDLKSIGFEIEPFGGDSFVLRAVPATAKPGTAETLLRDIIAELVETTVSRHLMVRPEQVIITTSCKMAIKAGDPLSKPEMEGLIRQLMETENPFVCPHGRPVIISLANWELDKKFKRPVNQ